MCAVRSAQRNRLSISSQQLHSSVRTGNLETCLRLLSLGAQANFFHPVSDKEKAFSLFACTQLEVLLNIVLLLLFSWPTGERKHSTTHSSQSWTGVPGRAAGGLRRRPRCPGLQRKDPHRLRKVTLDMCNFSFFFFISFHLVFI